ncbi:unnamed protein product [Adineta ricciae]|uniref:Uncharacterized protein n=1 Tax=Adineta ricciae TaxID=249248 RepID=A0A814QK14_ADIRI|nr:unnamed protein product [Adineta ricciae]
MYVRSISSIDSEQNKIPYIYLKAAATLIQIFFSKGSLNNCIKKRKQPLSETRSYGCLSFVSGSSSTFTIAT